VTLVKDMDAAGMIESDGDGQLHEPWVFLTMLDQMSTSEVNIGFIYSVIDLLARRYELTDVVVVLRDEALGTQAFRLGKKSLVSESPASLATSPGVFCEPDCVPHVVRDVVRNVCQLALTLHLARHSADHDPLTNIANRRHFDAALSNASVQSARYGWAFTLVLIDLNGFKLVNDRLGHAAGDDLLRSFGWALRRSVRSGDTTARLGGDEFAIILANAEGTEVLAFTERLRAQLVSIPDLDFSVGTATSPGDSTDPAELYRIADGRLYEKKGIVLR
jgi:diguanylate cyclase (GGDEF)-like protein